MAYNGLTNLNTRLGNMWFGNSFVDCVNDGIHVDSDYTESFVMEHIESVIGEFTGFVADLIDELASHYESDDDDSEDDD
jgi:hypothetical protein